MVTIVTMNVRGLNNDSKRKELFLYCKKLQYDIILMQETHTQKCSEIIFKAEWGGKIIFDHGESNARGVAVLFNPNVRSEIGAVTRSDNGRYLMIDCMINCKKVLITNIYTPNDDRPEFFVEIY